MRYVSHITAITVFLAFVWVLSSHAEERYSWKYLYTIDGDSLLFEALWSPLADNKTIIVRLDAVDSPELHAKCQEERVRALKAKEYVSNLLSKAKKIQVVPLGWDKFGGRLLGRVYADDVDVNDKLLREGLAREYHGEKKQGWC